MEAISEQGAKPLVTTKRFGKGKVVAILSNTLWRWRLAAGSNSTGVSPYDAFWNQLTDWVIPKEGKDNSEGSLELFMEKTSFELGENPEIHALLKLPASQGKTPATLPLAVKTPDGKKFDYLMKTATFRLPDGSQVQGYSSQVDAHVPGLFQATSSFQTDTSHLTAETRFLVTKPATEITGKPIGRDFLKKLAESSGGKFYEIDHWEEWTKDLHYSQQKFKQTEFKDLWNTPIILALIGIFLCIEWIIRKIWNLP